MAAAIENPVLNSPFELPSRHFRFDEEGITSEIVEARRKSAYFMPIAQPRKKGAQKTFETEWTLDRIRETTEVNRIRERIDAWRHRWLCLAQQELGSLRVLLEQAGDSHAIAMQEQLQPSAMRLPALRCLPASPVVKVCTESSFIHPS